MFEEADWTRFDFWAIVECRGLVTVGVSDRPRCRMWLANNNYVVHTLNFRDGISAAVENLGDLLEWQAQFGYRLSPDSRMASTRTELGDPGERKSPPTCYLRVVNFRSLSLSPGSAISFSISAISNGTNAERFS